MKRSSRPRRRLSFAAAILATGVGALVSADEEILQFDFETGDLQGWEVVDGAFDFVVCDKPFFRNRPKEKYNKQGRYFLTTLELHNGKASDPMTGVIESPVFVLTGPTVSFIVGGGSHDNTYVALCNLAGEELFRANGKNTETMLPVAWDVSDYLGQPVFLKVVDRNKGSWGHVTLDDVTVRGRLDPEGTRRRAVLREQRRLAEARSTVCAQLAPLQHAVEDLIETFGPRYKGGSEFLASVKALGTRVEGASPEQFDALRADFEALRREALLANPLVGGQPLLFMVRPQYKPDHHNTATIFQNDEINENSFRGGAAMKTIHFGEGGATTTLLDVPEGIARDPEVSFDARRILLSMRQSKADDYHIYEMSADGSGLRQVTFGAGLSDIDPFYMPNGQIGFTSTREPKYCQCNRHIMGNLFVMEADGANIRQIGRNALFEGHGIVLPDGRILYDRWEYVDRHFGPSFGLWTTYPDGTNHVLYYGNNAWAPGGIIDARIVPGTQRVVATFTSCHDRPWGAIGIIDRRLGMDGTRPVVHSWPADITAYLNTDGYPGIDVFKKLHPKYEDPYPLSDKYFLCSRAVEGEEMALFLIDVFGNELLLHREAPGCYDPMPIAPRPRPPVIPARVRLGQEAGYFYVQDVYRGGGMENVPRGTIRFIRVVEAPPKLFWTHTNWNVDATQAPAMNWNLTNNKRILGDARVEPDGSAYFAVPADTFVFFQALDGNRMMVQSMRSGTVVRPGETQGCIGCHEHRLSAVPNRRQPQATRRPPSDLEPWYGPPRPFNYLTEVQPVFDALCVECHDYGSEAGAKLNLSGDLGLVFNTSYCDLRGKSPVRWHPDPPDAPKPLVKAVDDGPPQVLPPYAWGSHRSRLVDALRDGHSGQKLDRESFDRIVTWIDMNAVYYGRYASAYPDHAFGRSPLDDAQLERLRELTGINVGDQKLEMQGSQVNFTRPELSPCLRDLEDQNDPKYKEALAIIEAGKEQLEKVPRADMPGFELVSDIEVKQQNKYNARDAAETRVREAIVRGERIYEPGHPLAEGQ